MHLANATRLLTPSDHVDDDDDGGDGGAAFAVAVAAVVAAAAFSCSVFLRHYHSDENLLHKN